MSSFTCKKNNQDIVRPTRTSLDYTPLTAMEVRKFIKCSQREALTKRWDICRFVMNPSQKADCFFFSPSIALTSNIIIQLLTFESKIYCLTAHNLNLGKQNIKM